MVFLGAIANSCRDILYKITYCYAGQNQKTHSTMKILLIHLDNIDEFVLTSTQVRQ